MNALRRKPGGSPRAARPRALLVALVLLIAGCKPITGLDLDMALYDPLPALAAIDFATIQPAQPFPYWELRFSLGAEHGEDEVIGTGGWLPRGNLPPEARATLDEVRLPSGFAGGCLPSWCFKYIVGVDARGAVITIDTVERLTEFVGPVGSLAEAVLLLDAHGYHWHDEDQGVREHLDRWEAVVLELVRACDPIQSDRVVLDLARDDGTLTPRRREVWQRLEGACV